MESVLNKHVQGSKNVVLDKRSLTRLDEKELMNEVSDQGKSEQTEAAKKPPTAVEKQEKIDGTTALNKDTSEETRERDKLELKENKETLLCKKMPLNCRYLKELSKSHCVKKLNQRSLMCNKKILPRLQINQVMQQQVMNFKQQLINGTAQAALLTAPCPSLVRPIVIKKV